MKSSDGRLAPSQRWLSFPDVFHHPLVRRGLKCCAGGKPVLFGLRQRTGALGSRLGDRRGLGGLTRIQLTISQRRVELLDFKREPRDLRFGALDALTQRLGGGTFLAIALAIARLTLRLGGALTIIGVVVSEMLTSAAGIGYLVTRYRTILDSAHVFGAIVMILLLSILFDTFARAIERRTMVWQTAGRRQKEDEQEPIAAPAPAPV